MSLSIDFMANYFSSITISFFKFSFVKYDSINKFHLFQVCCSMNFIKVGNCETTTVII